MINSTQIRGQNTAMQTRTTQHQRREAAVHFDTNTVCHFYPLTNMTTDSDRYELPANDSILQGAGPTPRGQFATNTTGATGCNEQWRFNSRTDTATHTNPQTHATRSSNRNGFRNNSPNSSDNRTGPTCFKCGEQGHMRMDCKERVFCTHCKTANHDTKACRKHHNSTPSPTNSHIPAGLPPHSNTTTTIRRNSSNWTTHTTDWSNQQHTIVPKLFRDPPTKNQHHHTHTLQRRITSSIHQNDRSPDTDNSTSRQQQQKE